MNDLVGQRIRVLKGKHKNKTAKILSVGAKRITIRTDEAAAAGDKSAQFILNQSDAWQLLLPEPEQQAVEWAVGDAILGTGGKAQGKRGVVTKVTPFYVWFYDGTAIIKAAKTSVARPQVVVPPLEQQAPLPGGHADDANAPLVVLYGEANLSFALAYARLHPTHRILATTYETGEQLQALYGDEVTRNVQALLATGRARIIAAVDCTKRQLVPELNAVRGHVDRVVFNFPHTGERCGQAAVDGMRALIYGYLSQARRLVHPERGRIQLSYVDSSYYVGRFDIDGAVVATTRQAAEEGARGVEYESTEPFDEHGLYREHGYEHRRTKERAAHGNGHRQLTTTFRLR